MKIITVNKFDFEVVRKITRTTIESVYPRYYPEGAVQFFLAYHSDERIIKDISDGKVSILYEDEEPVGTVTISGNTLNRLFVLPEYQHKGYGKTLLDFAEKDILKSYECVQLDASLPAKGIYLKRGYREIDYNIIATDTGDYLCYCCVLKVTVNKPLNVSYKHRSCIPPFCITGGITARSQG